MNSFIDAYKDFWRRYAQFNGRTSVGGFWRFVLVNVIIWIVLNILARIGQNAGFLRGLVSIVAVVYFLATIVPALALWVRRLHDTDKSGWLLLIGLTGIGGIVLIVFACISGTAGNNQYGPQPLANQWTTDGFPPGSVYTAQMPGGTPPPPPPA